MPWSSGEPGIAMCYFHQPPGRCIGCTAFKLLQANQSERKTRNWIHCDLDGRRLLMVRRRRAVVFAPRCVYQQVQQMIRTANWASSMGISTSQSAHSVLRYREIGKVTA